MRIKVHLYFTVLVFIFSSCVVSHSKRVKQDNRMVRFLGENKGKLAEAAAFAIDYTGDSASKEFEVKSVDD